MKIQELLPRLKKGWVAMDENKRWYWFEVEPECRRAFWYYTTIPTYKICNISDAFDLDPFDGDWKDSLMKCGEKK